MENTKNIEVVKRTERGWGGHYCRTNRCLFKRNTLLEHKNIKIVVSTVGGMVNIEQTKFEKISTGRYYETMCFHSLEEDDTYHDADVSKQVFFESNWKIETIIDAVDNKANDMHETVVAEISNNLLKGIYA